MASDIERRLGVLESRSGSNQRGTYEGLLALCEAGLLSMPELTDEELWWLLAGREEAMPDDAVVEKRLADVVGHK